MSKDYIPNEYKNKAEEIMREMYKLGYHDGINDGNINNETFYAKVKEAYNNGLNGAWEAARKIAELNKGEQNMLFGVENPYPSQQTLEIFKNFSATEAIEKIKEYESHLPDKDVGEIKIGDEVIVRDEEKGVVTTMTPYEITILIDTGGWCICTKRKNVKKTGKHYSQIAEVLRQMKGASE